VDLENLAMSRPMVVAVCNGSSLNRESLIRLGAIGPANFCIDDVFQALAAILWLSCIAFDIGPVQSKSPQGLAAPLEGMPDRAAMPGYFYFTLTAKL
jgi:hypothetical protein